MKVIGLTGFAKSGKSTAASILTSMGGQEVAFAKHLKDVCSLVFGVPRSHFDDQAFKELPFEFDRIIGHKDIVDILSYFEVPARFVPESAMLHYGRALKSPRHVAQYVGTEVLRTINQNIHIDMAFKLNEGNKASFLVCSDVRFDNELRAVQDNGGLVIGISRKAATPEDLVNLHPSEKEIPVLISKSNIIAANETTIEEFQTFVHSKAFDYLRK